MIDERPLPTTTMQLAGQASSDVIGGVAKTPLMLGVIVLNLVGIIAAVYFLNLLISGQQQHLKTLVDTLTTQQSEIISMHSKEFDALLALTAREQIATPPAVPSPPIPPTATPPPGRAR